jgi:hypothetical protein
MRGDAAHHLLDAVLLRCSLHGRHVERVDEDAARAILDDVGVVLCRAAA